MSKENGHPFDCECEECIENIYPGEGKYDAVYDPDEEDRYP